MTKLVLCFFLVTGMESVPTPGDMVGTKDPEKVKAAVAFLKFETTARKSA